jgi:hypothetical protein
MTSAIAIIQNFCEALILPARNGGKINASNRFYPFAGEGLRFD